SVSVGGLSFTSTDLTITYTSSTSTFTMTGDASFTLAGNTVSVDFGGGTTQGLVITQGSLVSLDMTVEGGFSVGGLSFTSSGLTVTYAASTSTFTMTGDASFTLASNTVSVDFGGD